MGRYLLSIDQGTTSSRAIVFDVKGKVVAQAQQSIEQHFPQSGWVEHCPTELYQTSLSCARLAIQQAGICASEILSLGITNQRETTLIWERDNGKPIYPAIVWQDRRTRDICKQWHPHQQQIKDKTGLLLDPYFSASKIRWILDHVEGAQQRAERGELAFGTVDSWLIWNLTDGRHHLTDATNASRTMLFNIHQQHWDETLLTLFNIPSTILPKVKDCAADFGTIEKDCFGAEIGIGGVAGDQQAALVGQACFKPGMVKSTYGTGCFMIVNTGTSPIASKHRLLTTIAYRLNGRVSYGLEGSIFMAGATIQWIRDGLKLIHDASDSQSLAEQTGYDHPVYMVPAFTGLGAPYWDADARGAIFGLSRDSGIKEVVTAGLQAVCYQTKDLLEAMHSDGISLTSLQVDGGMVVNDWLMQFLADILGIEVKRPSITETTALGVAYLAGLHAGIYQSIEDIARQWQLDQCFKPKLEKAKRHTLYAGWLDAVNRLRSTASA